MVLQENWEILIQIIVLKHFNEHYPSCSLQFLQIFFFFEL